MQSRNLPSEETDVVLNPATSSATLQQTGEPETALLSPAANDLLTQAKRKTHTRKRLETAAIGALIASLPFLWLFLFVGDVLKNPAKVALPLIAFFAILGPVVLALLRKINRSAGFDAEELARVGGVNALPALIDSLGIDGTRQVRKPLYQALASLLPQLNASDATLLSPYHRNRLNFMLMMELEPGFLYRPDLECSLAILKALEQVGDATAIPVVERLANRRPRNERGRKLKQAAEDCLPLLRVNSGAVQSMQTLLRASASVAGASDSLLRPAMAAAPSRADQLLRASPADAEGASPS